jgi:hypothetical protein
MAERFSLTQNLHYFYTLIRLAGGGEPRISRVSDLEIERAKQEAGV